MSQIVDSSVNDGAKLVSGTYGIILDILKSIDTLNNVISIDHDSAMIYLQIF